MEPCHCNQFSNLLVTWPVSSFLPGVGNILIDVHGCETIVCFWLDSHSSNQKHATAILWQAKKSLSIIGMGQESIWAGRTRFVVSGSLPTRIFGGYSEQEMQLLIRKLPSLQFPLSKLEGYKRNFVFFLLPTYSDLRTSRDRKQCI